MQGLGWDLCDRRNSHVTIFESWHSLQDRLFCGDGHGVDACLEDSATEIVHICGCAPQNALGGAAVAAACGAAAVAAPTSSTPHLKEKVAGPVLGFGTEVEAHRKQEGAPAAATVGDRGNSADDKADDKANAVWTAHTDKTHNRTRVGREDLVEWLGKDVDVGTGEEIGKEERGAATPIATRVLGSAMEVETGDDADEVAPVPTAALTAKDAKAKTELEELKKRETAANDAKSKEAKAVTEAQEAKTLVPICPTNPRSLTSIVHTPCFLPLPAPSCVSHSYT